MLPIPAAERLRQGEAALRRGDFRTGLSIFDEILRVHPGSSEALNDAGVAQAQLGDVREAVAYFERALAVDAADEAAFYNALDVLLAAGEAPEAADLFGRYAAGIPAGPEKARYAAELGRRTEERRRRVAFVCGPDRKFIGDIVAAVSSGHEVRTVFFDQQADPSAIQAALDWADVAWFEWCDGILSFASRKLRKTSRVVCRLHRYEAFTDVPATVNWEFVDALVLVAPHMLAPLEARVPDVRRRVDVRVIPNGVHLDRFAFREREPGFDLAYVGYIHHRKNPSLLLQCMHALVQRDRRYTLHIAGVHQQPEYELYFEHMLDALALRDNVRLYGWVDDVSAWLEDKQYLVSTSVHESFGYGIAEAMARGLKPLIHNFVGAATVFPERLLFDTVDEFVDQVVNGSYRSRDYRQYVAESYSLADQAARVQSLIEELVTGAPEGEVPVPVSNGEERGARRTTVVTPVYDRAEQLCVNLREGRYDGLSVQVVCDGSPPEVVRRVEEAARVHGAVEVHAYTPNRGIAHARAEAARQVETPYAVFCDDDDYLVDADAYLHSAEEALDDPDTLFVAMPLVVAFDEQGRSQPQYDRRPFDGMTGEELLRFLVTTGEMRLLLSGSVFRIEDLRRVPAEPFFRVSEDFTMLARLCALHPERRVRVMESGRFMRLIHAGSLSARAAYSIDKAVMNLASMSVGAHHLIRRGVLDREEFAEVLVRRGDVLQQSYGLGREAGAALAALVLGDEPPQTEGARHVRQILSERSADLPSELIHLVEHSRVAPTL